MLSKINFHTHTNLCDGKNSLEEMVKKAIELGFSALGFSGHAYTPCEPEYSMNPDETAIYQSEISRLRRKYGDKIDIFRGIEMDYYSYQNTSCFDYVIGSVHYLEKDGVYYSIDGSVERFVRTTEAFGGDVYSFIEAYYDTLSDVVRKTNADIIGHFDLIEKFNEGEKFFSRSHPRYIAAAERALDSLLKTNAVFEINTGAMARGYRSVPYPEKWILERIIDGGARVILSSDCHDAEMLDFAYCDVLGSDIGSLAKNSLITYEEIKRMKK